MAILNTPAKSPIYDSNHRKLSALEELLGVFQYRDLIYQLVRRDIVARYKRSVLGVAWTMLNPLGTMAVLTIVFSRLFNTIEGYPAYILSGLVAWDFFAQTTVSSMRQMVWGSTLLHRIYLPRSTFVISAVGTGLVNLVLSLVPLLLIAVLIGIPLHWSLLFLPVAMFFLAAFALGVGLLLSALAIFFPDVAETYQMILLAWMYLTPIIYPKDIIPQPYGYWLFHLNPMYYLIEIFRMPVYEGVLPSWIIITMGAGIAFVTLLIGWLFFSSKADVFTYRA